MQAFATFSTKHGRGHLIAPETLKAIGVMKGSGKKWGFSDRQVKRLLYTGIHEIPVFNLKIQDEPVL
jgi:hypothetical protein